MVLGSKYDNLLYTPRQQQIRGKHESAKYPIHASDEQSNGTGFTKMLDSNKVIISTILFRLITKAEGLTSFLKQFFITHKVLP